MAPVAASYALRGKITIRYPAPEITRELARVREALEPGKE
jgi:hypothetical protein